MSTLHEKLIRTTFALPLGEVHALVGGAVSAHSKQCEKSWYMGLFRGTAGRQA